MSEVRHRKTRSRLTKTTGETPDKTKVKAPEPKVVQEEPTSQIFKALSWLSVLAGIVAMFYCGYAHAKFMYTIHENLLWFTNIKVSMI